MYTASHAFFEALWEAGIRYCFCNLGTDHPSLIEAAAQAKAQKGEQEWLKFITCPNEMVALSMADGYARLTGKPQCVIVHVDVGTQGLGAAVHDASMGRAPVFIFAGLSPVTIEGEMRGSRTEYIHWIQDVRNQKEIVAQYCRYTGEIKTGKNVKQMVNRALSFALSDPKGPVYLVGAREIMEEEIEPYSLDQTFWRPIEPAALNPGAVERISTAIATAQEPLLITGSCGRNHAAVKELILLANTVKHLRVLDTAGSDMSFPANNTAWLGMRYGVDESIKTADVIVVLECDTPWIHTQNHPRSDAVVIHIDVDPLKDLMPVFYINACERHRADSYTALSQLNTYLAFSAALQPQLNSRESVDRLQRRHQSHVTKLFNIASLAVPGPNDTFGVSYLMRRLRDLVPYDTIWVVEAVTCAALVADQVQAVIPGTWINCGGGGLGWSGGAALGVKLAAEDRHREEVGMTNGATFGQNEALAPTDMDIDNKPAGPMICQVVGDGTYLFSVPSSVHWIAQRYRIPVLTIVLNNKGWNAPRRSTLLVHPQGAASKSTNEELNISFAPSPDYSGIATASSAGWCYGGRASTVGGLDMVLGEAVRVVKDEGRGALVDAQLDGAEGKFGGGIWKGREEWDGQP